MRILVIVHVFLPKSAAGSEYYTYYLAKELQRRGHDVHIYFTEQDRTRPHAELRTDEYDGLPCFVAVNNHSFHTFRHTYKDAGMEATLHEVLDEVQPEIVHIQHLHLHSIGYIDILKARGLKIVYTLHEYITMCHRNGQLLRDQLVLCEGPEIDECTKCARFWPPPAPETPGETNGETTVETAGEPRADVPAGPRPRYSLRRFLGKVRRRLGVDAPAPPPPPADPAQDPYRPAVERRFREVKAALAQVDLFISPSRFLRQKFIDYGFIEADQIIYSDNGMDMSKYRTVPRTESENLRVAFIGTITEWKGVHLLIEAFNGLPESGIECAIYGDFNYIPEYGRRLRKMRHHRGVRLMGRFDNSKIAEVLAQVDVLVVPSIWFENSPLTIHEAFLARVPVVCSDRGGMAELVEDGVNGLHFRMGDAGDLRDKLARLLQEPGLLDRIRSRFPEIKDIPTDADAMEERYHALLSGQPVAC